MKVNTLKVMKSNYLVDDMRLYFDSKGTHSNPTRKRINKFFKRRWRKEANRQFKEELKDLEYIN